MNLYNYFKINGVSRSSYKKADKDSNGNGGEQVDTSKSLPNSNKSESVENEFERLSGSYNNESYSSKQNSFYQTQYSSIRSTSLRQTLLNFQKLEKSEGLMDIRTLSVQNERFNEETAQELKDLDLITDNLNNLQLGKEVSTFDLTKSFVNKANSSTYIESDSTLIQINEFEYDEDNSVHFHYSVDVFEENIGTVLASEAFLFTEEEINWWTKYNNLSLYSKHLLVRLYIRNYTWHKQCQLIKYVPNPELFNECVDELVSCGLFTTVTPKDIPLEDTLKDLTLSELKEIVKQTLHKKVKLAGNKATITNSILKAIGKTAAYSKFFTPPKTSQTPLETTIIEFCSKLVPCFLTMNEEAWNFFNLVNRVFSHYSERYDRHVISESLRARVRNVNYINYPIKRSGKLFPTRKSLQDFDRALTLMKSISFTFNSQTTKPTSKYQMVCKRVERILNFWRYLITKNYSTYNSSYFLRFTPAFIYTKLINNYYIQSLAKLKLYTEEWQILEELLAQELFLQNERGRWWSRLCLVQASHLSKEDENFKQLAYTNCLKALQDPINNGIDAESANEIYNRMIKLEKKLKVADDEQLNIRDPRPQIPAEITIYGPAKTSIVNPQSRKPIWTIEATGEKVYTEEFALHHFKQEGWKGYHSENKILTSLFSLLFLDILFLPLPGAFETKFQTHPLDFGTEAFYIDRKPQIKARLLKISANNYSGLLAMHYKEHVKLKTSVVGLHWRFELEDLLEICKCIGGEVLVKIFELFCKNYYAYCSGMPDLCIWKPRENLCEFIEVKALSDTLSEKQKNWLGFLINCGVKVKVCLLKDSSNVKGPKSN